MTQPMRGMAGDVDAGVRGYASLNNTLTTQDLKPDFTVAPARVDPERDVVIAPGDASVEYDQPIGGYVASGQQWSFESANLVRYRPGGLSYAGALVRIPEDPPAGELDIGLCHVPFDDFDTNGTFQQARGEILLRLKANGDWAFIIRRAGVDTVIPRSADASTWSGTPAEGRSWAEDSVPADGKLIDDQDGDTSGRYWAFDACDGSGPGEVNPSGIDLDQRPLLILPKLIGTWYGKGPYFLTFETAGPDGYQRPYRAVAFEAEQQSISDRASLPLGIRYDDGGAGESYTAEVYGRQGSGAGEIVEQPKTPWHFQTGLSYGVGIDNAELLLAYRRAPEDSVAVDVNYRGAVYGLLKLNLAASERTIVFESLDIDFDGQTPDWGTVTSIDNQAETSIQVADQDVGGGDLTADPFSGTIQEAGQVSGTSRGSESNAVSLDPIEQPNARTKALGIFAFAADKATSDTDMLSLFNEEGA